MHDDLRNRRLDPAVDLVAYFCMEYGLDEALRIYSGGLGVLAGDHLRAAQEAGIPLIGVGLLYQHGYFEQRIDEHGKQEHLYVTACAADLPVARVLGPDGGPLAVAVTLAGREVRLNLWRVVGLGAELLLLDSDVPANAHAERQVTARLYGGGREARLRQEIVLGMGGVRALEAAGLAPTVWHMNEGHAAFQMLERCRRLVRGGMPFDEALELVAANALFTTHTPLPAGHDRFEPGLMERYFRGLADELGVEWNAFLRLGHNPRNEGMFDMTALALRGSRFHNGVSRRHRDVAAGNESHAWPDVPPDRNPMSSLTNGVHVGTFLAPEWGQVFDRHLGPAWREQMSDPQVWAGLAGIPERVIWNVHQDLKKRMLEAVRERARARGRRLGYGEDAIARQTRFVDPDDPDLLTIVFARRFAAYKRPTLLFQDLERLTRLLCDDHRPALLVFAGKAHPRDQEGQRLLAAVHEIATSRELEGRIVLIEGYDLTLARSLARGADLWLNTPAAPLEACGTSGQKAAINGVLNLSVLDGWWCEGFDGVNGWAPEPVDPHVEAVDRDRRECRDLLDIIETRVLPAYYTRDEGGVPGEWVRMCKASMASVIPSFNAGRMVREYAGRFYAAAADHRRSLEAYGVTGLTRWKARVAAEWPQVGARVLSSPGDRAGEPTAPGAFPKLVAVRSGSLQVADLSVEGRWLDAAGATLAEVTYHVVARHEVHLEPGELLFESAAPDGGPAAEASAATTLGRRTVVCVYPYHRQLAHRHETGRMLIIEPSFPVD